MINADYGIKIPEDGDKGAPVFDALENNIQKFIDHNHNGTNSAAISMLSLTRGKVNMSPTWTSDSRGFKQAVTCPGAVTLDKVDLRFRVRSGALEHHFVQPTVVPSSLTQFDVYVNDSSLILECLFT